MRYPAHTHSCHRCKTASVRCSAQPVIEEDGKYCPGDAYPDEFVCEDCLDLEMCEYCGKYLPREEIIPCYGDMYCKDCAQEHGDDDL